MNETTSIISVEASLTMFKEVIFVAIIIFVAWIIIFQLIVPFIEDRPLFPAFSKKKLDLEAQIAKARFDNDLEEMKQDLTKLKPVVAANNVVTSTQEANTNAQV